MSAQRFLNLSLRLLVAASIAIPLVTIVEPAPALACSGPGVPLPAERFGPRTSPEEAAIGPNSIVLLGSVLKETTLDVQFRSIYKSDVQVVVPFYGTMNRVIEVGPNGYGAPDCSGGPRLFPGEKVLLFLYPSRPFVGTDPSRAGEQGEWQSGQFGTPILFDGDDAYYLSWGRFSDQGNGASQEQRLHVGRSAEVLHLVLDYFNPTPAEQEAAYQFVLGRSAPRIIPQGTPQIVPPQAGEAGLASFRSGDEVTR